MIWDSRPEFEPGVHTKRDMQKAFIPKRADANQPQIVKTLRQCGFMVKHLHQVGNGVYDLLAEKYCLNILCEVKDGEKPPSARKLTPPQKKFNFEWRGMKCVLTSNEDVVRLNDRINTIGKAIKGIDLSIVGSEEEQYKPSLYVRELRP